LQTSEKGVIMVTSVSFLCIASFLGGAVAKQGTLKVYPPDCEEIFEYYEAGQCHKHATVQKALKFHGDVTQELDGDWQDYLEDQSAEGGFFATDTDFIGNEPHLDTFEVVDVGSDPEGRYHVVFNIRFVPKHAADRVRKSKAGPITFPSTPSTPGKLADGERHCLGGEHSPDNVCCALGYGSASNGQGGFKCTACASIAGGQFYSDTVAKRDNAENACVEQEACDVSDGVFYKHRNEPHSRLESRCQKFQPCNAQGLLVAEEGSEYVDRVCGEPIVRCTKSQVWVDFDSATFELTSQPTCVDFVPCAPGTYWSNKAKVAANDAHVVPKECAEKTKCAENEYVANVAQQKTDESVNAVCKPVTECGKQMHEIAAPTRRADRVCMPHVTCAPEEYFVKMGVCAPITVCDAVTQYLSVPSTPLADAVCNPLTECIDSEYVVQNGTATSDRVCKRKSNFDVQQQEGDKEGDREEKTPLVCANDRTWRKSKGKYKKFKNCKWVGKKPWKRCSSMGGDGIKAFHACPNHCKKKCGGIK